jgi:hydrogenase-4 component F
MVMVLISNNIILIWAAVEATTLGSTFLVGIYGRRTSLEAAWKYVIICTVGVAFALYGTILVYSDAVNFLNEPGAAILWTAIVQNAQALDPTLLKMAFVFILIGYGTKAGIFPMHAWLPDAHSEAPSPVSALLSGVLLNCALFVVMRFAIILDHGIGPQFTQTIFLVFGALSVAAAALFMFVQRDLKRLLAYSSVENIGLIVLAFGVGGPVGILAGLLQAVNHSLAKSLMFCTSGNIMIKYHTRDLGKIRGMLQVAPITSLFLMVGALALVGLPPFNIFISKFLLVTAGIASGYVWLIILCLLLLAVVFAAFLRLISGSVFGEKPDEVLKGEIRLAMLAPVVILVFLIVLLGIYQPPLYTQLVNAAVQVVTPSGTVAEIPDLLNLDGDSLRAGFLSAAQIWMP